MFGLSWWHILLVLIVFVLLFGAGRISDLMADTAKGLKSFKKGLADADDEASPDAKLLAQKHEGIGSGRQRTGPKAAKRS